MIFVERMEEKILKYDAHFLSAQIDDLEEQDDRTESFTWVKETLRIGYKYSPNTSNVEGAVVDQ